MSEDIRVIPLKLTPESFPIILHVYDMDAFPGHDRPLWTARVEGTQSFELPHFEREVRVMLISIGTGKVNVYPPLPTALQVHSPPELPPFAMVEHDTFPITIELFAVADREGHHPLWSRIYDRRDIIAPPPWGRFWPCWTRITNGSGQTWVFNENGLEEHDGFQ